MSRPRLAVVGAGIVGLAHAWSAAERGWDVTVFERSLRTSGASIRNFGMIWPIGQSPGLNYETALLSRQRWLRLATEAGLWVHACGAVHMAHRGDELAILEEFVQWAQDRNMSCRLLTAEQVQALSPAANSEGLLGGMFSETELCVNPREATRSLPGWLHQRYGVRFQFGTPVLRMNPEQESPDRVRIQSANGDVFQFERAIVCCGAELQTLFPEILESSGMQRCKLQMLSVRCPAAGWKLGPHLAGGLTLRHYPNFQVCPGLSRLKQRIADESPELDQFGIHVMASQNNHGDVILGDSHEYDNEIEPFDKSLIEQLILRELRRIICLPDWTVAERWHGIYARHPQRPIVEAHPFPGVTLCTGIGGTGMTMAFGIAERMWNGDQAITGDSAAGSVPADTCASLQPDWSA